MGIRGRLSICCRSLLSIMPALSWPDRSLPDGQRHTDYTAVIQSDLFTIQINKYKYTNTQIHKYTNTVLARQISARWTETHRLYSRNTVGPFYHPNKQIQIHKYTNTQIHKYTNTVLARQISARWSETHRLYSRNT